MIKKKGDTVLEAYLGSCVGLTLIDPVAEIGGLLHILLPEPTGTDVPFRKETYASTGVPVFVDAMCEAGAKKSRLCACIAGGAFVGDLSERDLWLDIGGRTAEILEDSLRERGIQLDQVETGGFFTCRMTLDLRELKTTIEPAFSSQEYTQDFQPLTQAQVDQAINDVKPIPQIALKVIRMIQDGDYDIEEVASEIRQDQVICGKILNLCNTAMIGLRNKIDSIDRALVVLGEKKLFQLVISASVESLFGEITKGYSLCKGGIFHHALGTAMIAHEISVFTGKSQPDVAYTAGLLHDIGKIALDQFLGSGAPYFYRKVHDEGIGLCKLEKEKFGLTHTEAGQILARNWELPENLLDTVTYHHSPENVNNGRELVSIIYLADLLISRFQVRTSLGHVDISQLVDTLEQLGLSKEQFPTVIDRIPQAVFDTSLAVT